jgi:hypothetical protein
MGIVYRPGEDPEPGAPPPAGLALGDAWFWHAEQTLLQALVEHPRVAPEHAAIRLLGFNGARLNQYIGDGAYASVIHMHLAPDFAFSEFYLGGFANDALEHRLALRDDCSCASDPAACFSSARLDLMLYHISEGLNGIIRAIRWAYRKTPWQQPIFLNGYDYPVPDGRGFVDSHGGWITTVMDDANVDPDLAFRTRGHETDDRRRQRRGAGGIPLAPRTRVPRRQPRHPGNRRAVLHAGLGKRGLPDPRRIHEDPRAGMVSHAHTLRHRIGITGK